ncbi:flavocytochrome c [Chloroflexota bacterium]
MRGKNEESTKSWDAEVDVVIAGAGATGLSAAIESADAGAETIVLEKQATMFECSSALSGGAMSFAGSDFQERFGIKDSNDSFYKDIMDVGQWKNDPKLVSAYVDNQLDTYNWLTRLGVRWGLIQQASGMSIPRAHKFDSVELIRLLTETARKKGVSILYRASVSKLFTDEEKRVIGVEVEEVTGKARIKVRKGVVLATGGFSRDVERLKGSDPRFVTMVVTCTGKGNTGDGHRMAKTLGAYERDIEYVKPTFGMHAVGTSTSELSLLYYYGAIIVNKRGERYVDESISYKDIGMATLDQLDGTGFQIFDQKLFDEAVARTEGCREAIPPEFVTSGLDKSRINLLVKGNTIEELAAEMNVPPEALRKTIDRYNNYVDSGKDLDFGRTTLTGGVGKIIRIERPPFYAYESRDFWTATYGGIVVDEDMHVLTPHGKIPGLYAAGEIIGGFHGTAYHNGTSMGKSVIFGRIAGRNVAKTR